MLPFHVACMTLQPHYRVVVMLFFGRGGGLFFYATAVFVKPTVSLVFYKFVTRGFDAVKQGKQRWPQSVSN